MYDNVEIYDGGSIQDENRLAMLCGNLTHHLPVFKSRNNSMVLHFHADDSRHYDGFTAKVKTTVKVEAQN